MELLSSNPIIMTAPLVISFFNIFSASTLRTFSEITPSGQTDLPTFAVFVITPPEVGKTLLETYGRDKLTGIDIGGIAGFEIKLPRVGNEIANVIDAEVQKNNTVYTLEMFYNEPSLEKIFDQILSTFKFTDSEAIVSPSPTPTPLSAYHITQGSSLNTYTNNVYSFSFNFPKSLFLYNSQSNSEYAGFLQKQGNINALRMYVDVFKNPNDLSLEEVEAKYNLKKNQGNEYALENTTINGKDAIIVAGNKSMRELCNYNDDQKRRVVVAALVKGSKYVLVFNTNNTCETFQEDWVSDIVNSVKL